MARAGLDPRRSSFRSQRRRASIVTTYGIHTNAQNKSLADLIPVWRHADDLGFGWISVSDHFPGSLGAMSNDAVACQMAIAASTSRAVCGVLVYSAGFRHPVVLAGAVTTIDHFSGGRAAIGLGAGAIARDYELYGFPLLSVNERMDILNESVQCVTSLLHDDSTSFSGRWFNVDQAAIAPRPLQDRLPVWVGAKGERRGLRIAAQHADGWNVGFVVPEEFSHKRSVLHSYCRELGRDPDEVSCSVNLLLAPRGSGGALSGSNPAAVLVGSTEQIAARLHEYVLLGVDQLNLHLPFPWDFEALESLANELGLRRALPCN